MFKDQSLRPRRKVLYQQWKRYKTTVDRLCDFKVGIGVVIAASMLMVDKDKDYRN